MFKVIRGIAILFSFLLLLNGCGGSDSSSTTGDGDGNASATGGSGGSSATGGNTGGSTGSISAICGNQVVEEGEGCDNDSLACNDDCTIACGDGVDPSTCGSVIQATAYGENFDQYARDIAVFHTDDYTIIGGFHNAIDLGGEELQSSGSLDIFLVQFSHDGTHLWSKSFGTEEGNADFPVAVEEDIFGNYYITGTFKGHINFSDNVEDKLVSADENSSSIFVAKFNEEGEHLWSLAFGKNAEVNDLELQSNGVNIYLVGSFEDQLTIEETTLNSEGNSDAFVIKLSDQGELEWATSFGGPGVDTGKGLAFDKAEDTDSSNLIFVGEAEDGALNFINDGILMIKMRISDGEKLWQKLLYDSVEHKYEVVAVDTDTDGNIFVAGGFTHRLVMGNGVVITSNGYEIANNNQVIGHEFDAFVAAFKPSGEPRWAHSLGGFEGEDGVDNGRDSAKVLKVYEKNNTSYAVVGGYFRHDFSIGDKNFINQDDNEIASWGDIFVAKFNLDGEIVYGKGFGGKYNETLWGLQNHSQYLYFVGQFTKETVLEDFILNPGYDNFNVDALFFTLSD